MDAIAFLFIIGILGIANFINVNKPIGLELENRALKQKPEFNNGTLTAAIFVTTLNFTVILLF